MMKRLYVTLFAVLLVPTLSPVLASDTGEKPVIGINMSVSEIEGSSSLRLSAGEVFIDAVTASGGIPIILPPVSSDEAIEKYVGLVDGFVFVGGPDINPSRFGQEPHETWNPIVERRETFDFLLMESALESGKPVLGVCLGMQMMAVHTGGNMIQDIPSQTDSTINHRPKQSGSEDAHDVTITSGTKLHGLLGGTTYTVNSIHHQACATTGPGVLVAARSTDGIIEAIEIEDHPFAIGVQWHPEYQQERDYQHAIFEGLVTAAIRQKNGAAVLEGK